MKDHRFLNRREFVHLIGSFSVSGAVGSLGRWLLQTSHKENRELDSKKTASAEETGAAAGGTTPRFAYVSYSSKPERDTAQGDSAQGILVFAIHEGRWTLTQASNSNRPSVLALHPTQRFLYAINEIDIYESLPCGAIEAYGINSQDGRLTLLNRQPLSLSGTMPKHLAVSPDGRNLVVAIHGGGAYNVLPIGADGHLGKISGIIKETGSGPDPERQEASHPQTVVFDTAGRYLLSADLGSDRLNVFALSDGKLAVADRSMTQPGSGPRHLAMHPSGHLLFVMNELKDSVSCYGYDAARGKILEQLQHVSTPPKHFPRQKNAGALMIHPSGQFLYTSSGRRRADHLQAHEGIAVWRIDHVNGALTPIQYMFEGLHSACAMTMASNGASLFVLDQKEDSVVRLYIDPVSGRLSQPMRVAKAPAPMSMVLKYI